jgi:YYY domain-containing protein
VLGALVVINAWDMPTYLGLMSAAFVLSRYRGGLRPLTWPRSLVLLVEMVGFTLLLIAATLLLYRPFFSSYVPLVSGLGLVKDKIPFDQFFKLWGFFLLIICTWLIWQVRQPRTQFAPLRALSLFWRRWNVLPHLTELYRTLVKQTEAGYVNALVAMGLLLLLALILLAFNYVVVALLLPWLVMALLLLLRWETHTEQSFVELLVFTGLLILLGVQFVFLKDWLGGGDHYRMNTYFKFFIQVWVMFGIAAGVMLPTLWQRADAWPLGWRWGWQMTIMVLIFSSLVFFVLGTRQRNDYRFPDARPEEATLDGLAYMTVGQFTWDNVVYDMWYDHQAIQWLLENVPGTPIIAEAKIGYYREAGMRVAAYTGLPSILGGLHQNEQHPAQQLGERDGLVRQFWVELDPVRFISLARQLEVEYIYFGQLERALYGEHHLQKFDQLMAQGQLELVYKNPKTHIFRVK